MEEKGKAVSEAKGKENRRGKAKATSNGKEREREKGKVNAGDVEASACRGTAAKPEPLGWGRVSGEIPGRPCHPIRIQLNDNRNCKRKKTAQPEDEEEDSG